MERTNKKVEDRVTQEIFNHIFDNGLGNILILKSIPTSTMKINTIGYFSGKLYFKLANGELKSLELTDIT